MRLATSPYKPEQTGSPPSDATVDLYQAKIPIRLREGFDMVHEPMFQLRTVRSTFDLPRATWTKA